MASRRLATGSSCLESERIWPAIPIHCFRKAIQLQFWDAIGDLPHLRSRLSKEADSTEKWGQILKQHIKELYQEALIEKRSARPCEIPQGLNKKSNSADSYGALRLPRSDNTKSESSGLGHWYRDNRLNHGSIMKPEDTCPVISGATSMHLLTLQCMDSPPRA